MKILLVHADFIEFEPKQKAIKQAEEAMAKQRIDECLVAFTAVEKGDEKNIAKAAEMLAKEIRDVASQVKANNIVLYPYAHLSNDLSSPDAALKILKETELILKKDFSVARAPFGWYKAFTLKAKGHPLAELSREIVVGEMSKDESDETYRKLIEFLDTHKTEYRLIDHEPEGRTEIVSPMRGNKLSEAAKCIVIMVKGGNDTKHVLCVFPGDAKLDLEPVKKLFGGTYASFATPDIAEKLAGSVSGTILPFSFNPKLELIVDPVLLQNDEIYFNAARLDRSMALKTKDYIRLVKPRIEKIAQYSEQNMVSEALKKEKEELKSEWFIIEPSGKMNKIEIRDKKVTGFDFTNHPKLKKLVNYEMMKSRIVDKEPPHIKLMRRLELVEYEEGSDPGNFRYMPKGKLVKSLLEDFVTRKTIEYGAMEVETPIMYDYEHPALKSYLNRFPARQYTIVTPNKRVFLRFSACFGQFLMAKDATISYRNLPMRFYELTRYSFRVEQRGELAGLRRLRSFTMPDCHALCKDFTQAKEEMLRRFELADKVTKGSGLERNDMEFAVRVVKDFFDEHKDFVFSLIKKWGKPAMVEVWDKRFFYFVLKHEWNFIDALDKAATLTTDQIDVENAERYGIMYTDADNKKKYPLILHLSPSGAIERVIYALLEKQQIKKDEAEKNKQKYNQVLPLWLSPTQIRLCPVNDSFINLAEEVAGKIEKEDIRVDVDDRTESVQKKIRDSEMEWVPLTVVIGEKEEKEKKYATRFRETGKVESLALKEIIEHVKSRTKDFPFKPLPLPRSLTKRPVFLG